MARSSSQASFARALLNIEMQKEENQEYEAWQEYQRKKAEDQSKGGLFGFVGALLGATIGVFINGPAGAIKGWGWGKQIGRIGHQQEWWGDEFDERAFLNSEIFKGGKFNRQKMQAHVEAEMTELDIAKDVDLVNLITDLASTYITASTLPGKEQISGWGDMKFFEKIKSTFTSLGQDKTGQIFRGLDENSNLVNSYINVSEFEPLQVPEINLYEYYLQNRGYSTGANDSRSLYGKRTSLPEAW